MTSTPPPKRADPQHYPAKVYSAGNVTLVEQCPTSVPNSTFYMCEVLNTPMPWATRS